MVRKVSRRANRPLSVPGALEALDQMRRANAGCKQPDAMFRETAEQVPAGVIDNGDIPQENAQRFPAVQSL